MDIQCNFTVDMQQNVYNKDKITPCANTKRQAKWNFFQENRIETLKYRALIQIQSPLNWYECVSASCIFIYERKLIKRK